VTIGDFNGWNVLRLCESNVYGGLSGNPDECRPGGDDKIFFDYYDDEYSRDIEPELGGMGSFYYDLVKSCVQAYKRGERCALPQPSPRMPAPLPGRFNGDRISDYADQYIPHGSFWIHLADRNGSYGGNWAFGYTASGRPGEHWWRTSQGTERADYADYLIPTGQMWIHKNITRSTTRSRRPLILETGLIPHPANNPYVELLVGDFTGDGKADIAERNLLTGQIFIRENRTQGWMGFEYVNSGAGFRTMTGPDWTTIVADFNGDGLADIADLQLSSNIFWVHLNRGAAFGFDFEPNVYVWADGYGSAPKWKLIVGDFNGDGKADYADLLDNGTFWVHLNNGDATRGSFDRSPGDGSTPTGLTVTGASWVSRNQRVLLSNSYYGFGLTIDLDFRLAQKPVRHLPRSIRLRRFSGSSGYSIDPSPILIFQALGAILGKV